MRLRKIIDFSDICGHSLAMKTRLQSAFENTGKVISAIHSAARDTGPTVGNNDWMVLAALTPPILAAFAVTEIGAWVIGEIGRQIQIHEKRPASPSLRGTPTPKEIASDWNDLPRTLETCLRLGSRLADLDPTLDHALIRERLPNGKMVIRARKGGMKGWLADHRVKVGYSTVMRYKKLVQRIRLMLELDDRIPLEWVMSGVPDGQRFPEELEGAWRAAHRRFAKILRENPTLKTLSLAVEKALGIVRIVAVRRGAGGRRGCGAGRRKNSDFSVISQERSVTVTEERAEATKGAMLRVLRARNLSGTALQVQNRIRHWLAGVAVQEGRGERAD